MFNIAKNRFLDALLKLMLLSAIVHAVLVVIFSFLTKDLEFLNYFYIIGLNLFFPNISMGITGQILSAATVVAFYTAIFLFFTKN